jgi:hypothetical protein
MPGYGQVKKEHTGAIYVEKEALWENFLQNETKPVLASSSADSISGQSRTDRSIRSHGSKASKVSKGSKALGGGSVAGVGAGGSLATQSSSASEAKAKALLERSRARAAHKKDKEFARLQSDMKESLDFLDSVDRELNLVNETKRTKVRRQFEDWNKNVHGSIQRKILKEINSLDKKQLHRRKLESYGQFLDITNRKAAIFRDIIIESEYDPLEANKMGISAKTTKLKDPLNIDVQKAEAELGMLGLTLDDGGHNKSDRLAPPHWAKGKIEATPYGMFATMMEDGEAGKGEDKNRKSRVVFDDFDFPRGKEAVDKEMPKPKPHSRKVFTNPKAFVTDPKTGEAYSKEVLEELMKVKPDFIEAQKIKYK